MDPIADLFHCIDHLIERNQMLIVRQSHVCTRNRIGRGHNVSPKAWSFDAIADRVADQTQRILQGK